MFFSAVHLLETSTLLLPFGFVSYRYVTPRRLQGFAHITNSARQQTTALQSRPNDEEENDNCHTITFQTANSAKEIDVKDGEILRSALLKRGVSPHNGNSRLINCRGLGTCGTCAVEITPASKGGIIPMERSVKENLRLSFPPHNSASQAPNLRLACQVQICDDVTVVKRDGFWGQGENLAEEFDANLYFGDLEYVLDNLSPPTKTDKKSD